LERTSPLLYSHSLFWHPCRSPDCIPRYIWLLDACAISSWYFLGTPLSESRVLSFDLFATNSSSFKSQPSEVAHAITLRLCVVKCLKQIILSPRSGISHAISWVRTRNCKIRNMGHCWPRTLPKSCANVLQRSCCCHCRV